MAKKLEIVSKIRINGKLYLQGEVDPKEFRQIVEEKVTQFMEGIGFKKNSEES